MTLALLIPGTAVVLPHLSVAIGLIGGAESDPKAVVSAVLRRRLEADAP